MKINLQCPINFLGYGIASFNIYKTLKQQGHEVSLWPLGQIIAKPEHHALIHEGILAQQTYSKDAPSIRIIHPNDLAQHCGHGKHIGFPIFELTKFNAAELNHLNNQDLVLCTSEWASKILVDNGIPEERIVYSPLGVDREIFKPLDFNRDTASTPTVFLNVGKWEIRKGHDFLMKCFNLAFEETDNVALVMNCDNPCMHTIEQKNRYNQEWERLYETSKLARKIRIIKDRLPSQESLCHLINQADCGIFPARAEGWNLDLLEMLSCGKHCIATNYSAHTEYLSKENCHLIEIDKLEPAYDGLFFKTGLGEWAKLEESQLEQCVCHMRKIHELKQGSALPTNHAGIRTALQFSWDNTVKEILSVL